MKSHQQHITSLNHVHDYNQIHSEGEKRTLIVLWLTAITMIIEIVAGSLYGSMALLADGWHMSTHVAAFGIALFAYRYVKANKESTRFSFGTAKVSVLGGFTSAVALGVVAFIMLFESLYRFIDPHTIQFNEAISVAILGLVVNLASAYILKDSHHHHHRHDHTHDHHHHHDHNLKAAYMHVLADALTSIMAIVALFAGKYFGWMWLDPMMGIVGALIIAVWAWGLLRETAPILLDETIDETIQMKIKESIEADADSDVTDMHIWRVGPKDYAVVISILTHTARSPKYYKEKLSSFDALSHITVEVNVCEDEACR